MYAIRSYYGRGHPRLRLGAGARVEQRRTGGHQARDDLPLLDLERFTMFTLSPIANRSEVLVDWVKQAKRDDKPLKDDVNVP